MEEEIAVLIQGEKAVDPPHRRPQKKGGDQHGKGNAHGAGQLQKPAAGAECRSLAPQDLPLLNGGCQGRQTHQDVGIHRVIAQPVKR